MKSSRSDQLQFTSFAIENLYASHIGRHQADRAVEHPLVENRYVALTNERGADLMQTSQIVRCCAFLLGLSVEMRIVDLFRFQTGFFRKVLKAPRHFFHQ